MEWNGRNCKIEQFMKELASKAPVPGGGGVAALGGALGCSLGCMVANLTIGKKAYAQNERRVQILLHEAEQLQEELLDLIDEDAHAFTPLAEAYSLPAGTAEEKEKKETVMEQALIRATLVPLRTMERIVDMIKIHKELAPLGSRMAISDVGTGVQFCRSALLGASMNVFINTKSMKNRNMSDDFNQKANQLIKEGVAEAEECYQLVMQQLMA